MSRAREPEGVRRAWRARAAVLALGLAAACGDGSSSGADAIDPVPEHEYPARSAHSVCAVLTRCCSESGLPIDEQTCRASATARFRANYAAHDFDAVRYDGAAAARCIREFQDVYGDCVVPDDAARTPSCQAIFVGLRREGEPCDNGGECAHADGERATCNDAIDPITQAVTGRFCRIERPIPHGRAGEPCRASCDDRDQAGVSICASVIPASGAIVEGADCYTSDGLQCVPDPVSGRGVCEPLGGTGASCALNNCEVGLFCDSASASCQPRRTSGECASEFNACAEQSFCATTGDCEPQRPDGAACDEGRQCLSGNCGETGVCGPRVLGTSVTCREPF